MTQGSARMTGLHWLTLAMLASMSASAYLSRYCLAAAATVIESDLKITSLDIGSVVSAFMVGYLIGQVPGGWLGTLFGARRGLAFVSIAWSVGTAWSAYCTSVGALGFSRFFVGIAQAGLVPISAMAVKDWFPESRRGTASSAITAAMSAGGVLAMRATGRLLTAWEKDWRLVFLFYAALGIAWSLIFFALFRSRPADWNREVQPDVDNELVIGSSTQETRSLGSEAATEGAWFLLKMLMNLSAWAIAAQWFFRAFGYQFYVSWLPAFLEKRFGLRVDEAGQYTSWPLLSVAVGALAGGPLVDFVYRRTGSKFLSRNVLSLSTMLVTAVFVQLSLYAEDAQQFMVTMTIGAIFCGISMPIGWAANIDVGGRFTPLFFAVMNMAATAAGVVSPLVVGGLLKRVKEGLATYDQIIWLHVGIYLAAAAVWLFIDCNRTIAEEPG